VLQAEDGVGWIIIIHHLGELQRNVQGEEADDTRD